VLRTDATQNPSNISCDRPLDCQSLGVPSLIGWEKSNIVQFTLQRTSTIKVHNVVDSRPAGNWIPSRVAAVERLIHHCPMVKISGSQQPQQP
jgi:hypothetical protein